MYLMSFTIVIHLILVMRLVLKVVLVQYMVLSMFTSYKISLFREEYEDCGESWLLRIVDDSSRSLAGIEVRDMGELVRAMGIYIE